MRSRWSDEEAGRYVERYAPRWGEALALRVYSSRLIGSEPALVLHGGGNTSLKGTISTLVGDRLDALWVKGSGSDLDQIEPPGFPALDLAYLRRLRTLEELSDREMVNQLRTHLFNAGAPNPSVETLLHAFLPHAWIDHTHADAIVALTNHVDGEALVRESLGPRVGIVPYVMPGFRLARVAAEVFEQDPTVDALVLMHHGLFTFADDVRTSYERTIQYVDLAEGTLLRAGGTSVEAPADRDPQAARSRYAALAPLLRGLLAEPSGDADQPWRHVLLDLRTGQDILALLDDPACARLSAQGPLTPDHVIRTKASPLFVPGVESAGPEQARATLAEAIERYRAEYDAYFGRQQERSHRALTRLSSSPTVVLLPGIGIVGAGGTARDAAAVADIAERSVRVKAAAERLGAYQTIGESDLFDVEYWSLEQAKLGARSAAALAGTIALITGGAGAMGLGIARQLLAAGAHVALGDVDQEGLERVAKRLAAAERVACVPMDVTDEVSVDAAIAAVCARFGGLDLCVVNAGVARMGALTESDSAAFRLQQDVNATGCFLTVRAAARTLISQGLGGNIVVNATKNVFAPGAQFGGYSASKAAAHQLGKVAALELAKHGIRVNMINADAVFGDDQTPSRLWLTVGPERARMRGLDPDQLAEHYRQRNLLKAEVRADHVGRAVVFFASNQTPTTGATLPIDGGIPEAFPR